VEVSLAMDESPKSHKLELGIELCLELAIGLYQLGAEQMDLPHSFKIGFFLWIAATALFIRMFWIFPLWENRLPRWGKALISIILIGLFAVAAYEPVVTAYRKNATETKATPQSMPPQQAPQNAPDEESKTEIPSVKPIPSARPLSTPQKAKSTPSDSPSQPKSGPIAIAPNGIANAAPNFGTQTVNNLGTLPDVPESGVIPIVTICSSESLATGDNKYFPGDSYITTITLQTNTPITRPSYGFLFDGAVGDGHASVSGISTTAYVNDLKLVNYEDTSYAVKLITVDYPSGSDRWSPGVVLKATVPSRGKVKLEKVVSWFGKEQKPLGERREFTCDLPINRE
jgi:hypothetical protein